jgi:hypothetical protein
MALGCERDRRGPLYPEPGVARFRMHAGLGVMRKAAPKSCGQPLGEEWPSIDMIEEFHSWTIFSRLRCGC